MRCYLVTILAVLCASNSALATWRNASEAGDIVVNDDGTASLTDPYFTQGGESHWLSEVSSPSGICRLFGFADFVPKSGFKSASRFNKTVVISVDGHFQEFRSDSRITSLICQFETTTLSFDSSGQNPDGSTTISNLRVGNDTFARRISSNSDKLGLCRRLGFGGFKAVAADGDASITHRSVNLGSDGQATGFAYSAYIDSISCY